LISLFTPLYLLFLYNALSPTIIYTLSLHDALPIYREYVTPSGRLVSSTQTAYVLALQFDMLPQELRQQAAKRLVQNIESYNNHLTTGFLGTSYLCHVLTKFGYDSVAYKLLLQETRSEERRVGKESR